MIEVNVEASTEVCVCTETGSDAMVEIDNVQIIARNTSIEFGTVAYWAERVDYIPAKGSIIVYEDYKVIDGNNYPAIKIADGVAYLIDQPYVNQAEADALYAHILNTTVHVTEAEKEFWNNKVSCYEVDGNLVFTTD